MRTELRQTKGKRRGAGLLALLAFALVLWPLGSGAEEGVTPAFTGTWVNTAGDHGRQAIAHGIEQGINDMFSLAKPTARSRLTAANPPIPRLELEVRDSEARYDLGHGRSGRQAHGLWRPGRTATGDTVQVRVTLMSSGALKIETRADGGSARHIFRLSDDGSRLTHDVRIHSTHLPDDIRYRLSYRRAR